MRDMAKNCFTSLCIVVVVVLVNGDVWWSQPYTWNKTAVTAENYLAGYGPKVCSVEQETCFTLQVFPCGCGEHCRNYGTCCSDRVPGRMTQVWPETTGCLEDKTYAMVRCPQSWGDGDVRKACETGQGKYTVDEPVTDLSTNVTFRNAFCAQCHGVESYTAWGFNVTCEHFQFMFEAGSQREFLDMANTSSLCSLEIVPPDHFNPSPCPYLFWFSAAVVNTCNVTGNWATENYDKDFEQNCPRYTGLSLRIRFGDHVFQNLFCAVCNGAAPNITRCPKTSINTRPTIDGNIGHPPLSLLLGIKETASPRDLYNCSGGKWLDHSNECRNLTCTPGKVIVNGTCSTAVSQIRGLMYSLNLTLVPTADVFLSAADVEVAKAHLSFEILQKLQTTASRFTITASLILKDSFGPLQPVQVKHLKVSGDLTTFRNITRDEVEITLVGNLFSDWEMTFSDRNASFRHSSVLHRSLETGLNSPGADKIDVPIALMDVDDFTSSTIPPDLHIPLSPLLLCPYLEFSPSEYEIRAKEGNNSVSEVALKFGDKKVALPDLQQAVMHNGTLQVCLETLEALPREKADDPLKWQYILSMVIIPLSIVCIVLTLIVYALLPVLRTQPGLNTMGTCCALLVAQVTLLLASHRVTSGTGCTALGMVVHMAWLSMFCWTSVCSAHMFRVFSSKTYRGSGSGQYWKVVRNIIITVLLPAAVVGLVVGVSYHTSGGASIGYSSAMCYLESALLVGVAMVLPVSVILLLNLLLFVLTVRGIHKVTKLQPRAESEGDSRQHLHVCARLSVLTGATWILSVIAEAWGITWLQAIAILTNGGQGILLFLSYVTTRRVTSMLAVKLGLREKDVSSARTHTTSDKYTSSIRTKSHHEQRIKSHIEQ